MSLYARGMAYKPTEGVDRYTLTDTPNTLGNLVAQKCTYGQYYTFFLTISLVMINCQGIYKLVRSLLMRGAAIVATCWASVCPIGTPILKGQ